MGREVKRVPAGFDWPLKEIWWGYEPRAVACETCRGTGAVPWAPEPMVTEYSTWDHHREEGGYFCPHCEGEGTAYLPHIEVPCGPWYQMWETTSEGSPISPPFATPEELARWLADNRASTFGDQTATYEQWLAMIAAKWAPSMVVDNGRLVSGVEFVAEMEVEG